MSLYADRIFPALLHLAMRNRLFRPFRARLAGAAAGRVLEIGVGSGLNLPFYGAEAREVIGLDPSPALLARAARLGNPRTRLLEASAEAIPLDAASIDTVLSTWTMCSIPDASRALGEIRRVLRPGGALLFVEHGRAPEPGVARWQDRLDPLWTRLAGGCHINREITALVEAAGFRLDALRTTRLPGPRTHTFLYEGRALPN